MSLIFLLSAAAAISGQASCWDPDAGIIESYTKASAVTVTATSGSTPEKAVDGDDNTNWVSGYCLPGNYLGRADVNILYNHCANAYCTSTSSQDLSGATDGSVYTTALVQPTSGEAKFTLTLASPTNVIVLTINGIYNDNASLNAYDINGQRHEIDVFNSSMNYKSINTFMSNYTIEKLEVTSAAEFRIKEIGAIGPEGCTEEIKVDFGSVKSVGTVRTRHWAGTNAASLLEMRLSTNGSSWITVASLDPNAVHAITTSIPEQPARYLSLRYTVNLRNYLKVYCFEIDAWDENGIWGPKKNGQAQHLSFSELLGVNGIWGWGHQKYSNALGDNEGPNLYNKIASNARNYHNLVWDVTDPDLDPEFPEMAAGGGTQAMWWLNWDTEYSAWKNANLSIDVSIQFTNKSVPQYKWDTPEASAFHYGREFAKHFGSVQGNGLIDAVEVGNEPWDYEASFYASVLKGMSAGIRSADDQLIVVAGTFQAEDKFAPGTYIGTRVLEDVAVNISVINCHTYSFVNDDAGIRRGTYPENKHSSFNNIRPLIRWRDTNTPNKPLWVTEWGWDADGLGENCKGTECVSQKAQAVYGIRGLLIFARSNIERATWYFYANTECETLFCRSGLTTTAANNFQKKTVFAIFEEFLQRLGGAYFLASIQENEDGYIYALSSTPKPNFNPLNSAAIFAEASHVIAWLPVDISDVTTRNVTLTLPADIEAQNGVRFTGNSVAQPVTLDNSFSQTGRELILTLSTEPYLIEVNHYAQPIVG